MLLTSLAFTLLLSAPQVPVHEGPDTPAQVVDSPKGTGGLVALWKMRETLVGGEWHVDEHFVKKSFQRFVSGYGGSSIYVETRDKDQLSKPLPSLSVIFADPDRGLLRGIAISDHGAFSDSVYRFQDKQLVRTYRYHLADGSSRNAVVSEKLMELESHWDFEAKSAYRWQLFQKTPTGMASIIETTFTHQDALTELPKGILDPQEASRPLEFLAPLQGERTSSSPWKMSASWRVKGMGLWVKRTMPHPYAGWDKVYPKIIDVEGFFYWNPIDKQTQFIGFSKRGEVVKGVTIKNDRRQIETTYTVGPPVIEQSGKSPSPHGLGEQIQTNEDGTLSITWISIGSTGKPKVTEASFK